MVKLRTRTMLWWRNASLARRFLYFLILSGLLAGLLYVQLPEVEATQLRSSLVFFVLINASIIGIAVLAFVIGRNVVKLVFDRQEGILGSKLRTKLVLAFVGLTLVPTIILFVLASGLISSAMEGWFGRQVEEIVTSSIEVARDHYDSMEKYAARASDLARDELIKIDRSNNVEHLAEKLESLRQRFGFFSVKMIDSSSKVLAEATSATSELADFKEPPPGSDSVLKALNGESVVSLEEEGPRQFVRSYQPIGVASNRIALVFTLRVNPEISAALGTMLTSYDEYKKMSFYKQPLKSSYVLALALITGLILFAAIWFGFYLAREITVPVQRLAEGTREVALGNLDLHIREGGDDELSFLIGSFNKMTRDLKGARLQLEERQQYLEAILSNLSVGVVAVDLRLNITLANTDARVILGIENLDPMGLTINLLPTGELKKAMFELLDIADQADQASTEKPVKIIVGGRQLEIICSVVRVTRTNGEEYGYVFILEDVTDLSMAHQMAAWREVARRIAHEIKNPLTPIKLSAQRLERLTETQISKSDVVDTVQTIVENVESIKRLANEFSNFARMPTAEFVPTNFNNLVSDVLMPFIEQNSEIVFQIISDKEIPVIDLDPEQIRRLIMNLVDNAIAAVMSIQEQESPKIVVKTELIKNRSRVLLEISDNGPGIKPEEKNRIFEPYFTTKNEGTGLGLAIVNSVVADHKGTIRVFDAATRGTRFVIELPLRQGEGRSNRASNEV